MTTDGYVVSPLFFPGGNIGSLPVHGTINDVAFPACVLSICRPVFSSRGLPVFGSEGDRGFHGHGSAHGWRSHHCRRHQGRRARQGGWSVHLYDRIGIVADGLDLSADKARVGDRVLVAGSLGDHGVAIMSKRQNLPFQTEGSRIPQRCITS